MEATSKNEEPRNTTERLAYSIQEAADMLGVHYFSIYRLIQNGKLKVCRALRGKTAHSSHRTAKVAQIKINENLWSKRNPQSAKVAQRFEKKGFKRAEAAIYLGVTPVTIDRLRKRGLLHPSLALRHPIYSRDDLDRFLRETTGIFEA